MLKYWLACYLACVKTLLHGKNLLICDSEIHCNGTAGTILETVQMSGLFNDSKIFVDMHLSQLPDVIIKAFDELKKERNNSISLDDLDKFVKEYFNEPGHELNITTPEDWIESPPLLVKIKDDDLKDFAKALNLLWKKLHRTIKPEVHAILNKTSLIYVPHPFIVPGGRFREYYYWDSYWLITGILLCNMTTTARGMIENFATLVNTYGFVPNGGRVYYTKRSQPPFLTLMVYAYYNTTGDLGFLRTMISALEKEHRFWKETRNVSVSLNNTSYELVQYRVPTNMPRPEGFKEDVIVATNMTDDEKRQTFQNIASACESGWDFSSRWFKDQKSLATVSTLNIVPVDLNAIICGNEKLLAHFFGLLGNDAKRVEYQTKFNQSKANMKAIFWNSTRGFWMDYNITKAGHNDEFYIAGIVPLFTGCYDINEVEELVPQVLQYLKRSGVLDYPAGTPSSLNREAKQQWDFPNAWAPYEHMLIEGLAKTGVSDAQTTAQQLAAKCIKSIWKAWKNYGYMFEKYDVQEIGKPGGNAEYETQLGFGWTNAVALLLMSRYPESLMAPQPMASHKIAIIVLVVLLLIVILVAVISIYCNRKTKKQGAFEDTKYDTVS